MNSLVFIQSNNLEEIPFTTSKIIAKNGYVQHETVVRLITKYEEDLKEFGILRFEIGEIKGRGQPEKMYKLNEQQATLVITYMQNTLPVRNFKKSLIKEFYEMKRELNKRAITRGIAKDKRNTLTDALDKLPNSPHKNFKYRHYTDLAYKIAFSKNTDQLRKHLGIENKETPRDYLSEGDLKRVEIIENEIAVLVGLKYDYQTIKTMIGKKYMC